MKGENPDCFGYPTHTESSRATRGRNIFYSLSCARLHSGMGMSWMQHNAAKAGWSGALNPVADLACCFAPGRIADL